MGFEIFDKTNFGTTDFAEQINYHRAIEGELERSVMALAAVEQARVHVTFPKDSIYLESRQPAKASVMVKLRLGAKLSPLNVLAITHLTASAVEELFPEGVSVLDMNGNLLNRPRKTTGDGSEPSEMVLEYKQKAERDLLMKINATLEPLLGADKYRTGVSLECDVTSGEQSEETYDPTKSVMVTSQRTEDGTSAALSSGVPGTASNLPRPTSRPMSGGSGSNRRTENVAYQSSRLVKHLKLPAGTIKRISVSVLLDQAVRFEKGKRILDPPSPEKLKVVKDLVTGIAGVVPDRGDQIIVETFPFDSTLSSQPQAAPVAGPGGPKENEWAPPWLREMMKSKSFVYIAAGAGTVLLILFGGGLYLLTRSSKKKGSVEHSKTLAAGETAASVSDKPESLEHRLAAQIAEQAQQKELQRHELLSAIKLPPVSTMKTEVLVKHITSEIKKDPLAMAQVIRSWISTET
jgi:flagellar M-ring protein FliF